jgi:hypothetical protein
VRVVRRKQERKTMLVIISYEERKINIDRGPLLLSRKKNARKKNIHTRLLL